MSESEQSGAGRREVAYRIFATEYEDADLSYSESEEERAPNYVITPTGARVNRLFVVGVLTEVEQVSENQLRARVVDPTGAFVLYAGQYQPDEQAFLEGTEPPTFVAVTGKARTFQPEDSDRVYTSVRPESINEVDADTRDRWTVQAAEQTIDRVGQMATALSMDLAGDELEAELTERGVDDGLAAGIPIALDHYGTTPTYLDAVREIALDAARVVAGEHDEVTGIDISPDEQGSVTVADLVDANTDVDVTSQDTTGADREPDEHQTDTTKADSPVEGDVESAAETASTAGTESSAEVAETPEAAGTESKPETDSTAETAAEDLGDFDPGEFELEEGTREQIEEEYGTEFQSGTEVEEPGEADIETPETEAVEDAEAEAEAAGVDQPSGDDQTATEGQPDEQPADGEAPETATAETDKPDDLQAAVIEVMQELDDGSGAKREALKAEMETRYGVPQEETEEAIQQALMDGQCYEPDDTTLKSI